LIVTFFFLDACQCPVVQANPNLDSQAAAYLPFYRPCGLGIRDVAQVPASLLHNKLNAIRKQNIMLPFFIE